MFLHDTPHRSNDQTSTHAKLLYNTERVPIFRNELLTCSSVLDQVSENVNSGQIDTVVTSFTNYLYDSAFVAFARGLFFKPICSGVVLVKVPYYYNNSVFCS